MIYSILHFFWVCFELLGRQRLSRQTNGKLSGCYLNVVLDSVSRIQNKMRAFEVVSMWKHQLPELLVRENQALDPKVNDIALLVRALKIKSNQFQKIFKK